jgi:hypothetical protein
MQLRDIKELAPIVDDWTIYINRILTKDVMQVSHESQYSGAKLWNAIGGIILSSPKAIAKMAVRS